MYSQYLWTLNIVSYTRGRSDYVPHARTSHVRETARSAGGLEAFLQGRLLLHVVHEEGAHGGLRPRVAVNLAGPRAVPTGLQSALP